MSKLRKRRDTDAEYFVELIDVHSERRVAVGNFWAGSPGEAVEMAQKTYRALFDRMETNTWSARATQVTAPRKPLGGLRGRDDDTVEMFSDD